MEERTSVLNALSRAFSLGGDTYTVIGIASAVVLVGLIRHRRHRLNVLVVGMLGEVTIFLTITAIVSRPRPEVDRLDGAPPTSSFPSGHTFAAIVLWGALAVVATRSHWAPALRRLFLVLMVVMPIAIGLSRLSRGMHHLTDVLASLVLGALWLTAVVTILRDPASSLEAGSNGTPHLSHGREARNEHRTTGPGDMGARRRRCCRHAAPVPVHAPVQGLVHALPRC